jgi:hypothetical protein
MSAPEQDPRRDSPAAGENCKASPPSNGSARALTGRASGDGARRPFTPPALSSGPTALALLKALRRRWLLAFGLGACLACAAAAVVWFLLPPARQGASIKLFIAADPEGVLFKHPEANESFENFQQRQNALIRCQMVLEAALRQAQAGKPPVATLKVIENSPDPVGLLEKELKVDFPGSREIMRISMEGDDQEELKVLVDAIAEAYLSEVVAPQTQNRQGKIDKLNELMKVQQDKLKTLRGQVRKVAEDLGAGDLHVLVLKQQLAQERHNKAQTELLDLESDLRKLQTDEATLKAQEGTDIPLPEQEVAAEIEKDPSVKKHRERVGQLETLLEETKARVVVPEVFAVQQLSRDLERAKKDLEEWRKRTRPDAEALVRNRLRTEATTRLTLVRERIRERGELKKARETEVNRLKKEGDALNQGAWQLGELQPEIKKAEAMVANIENQIDRMDVEKDDLPRVTRLRGEQAVGVRVNELPRKLRFAGLAAAAAFGIVAVGVALLEFRSRRIDSVAQVTDGLGMNVVGTVPPPRGVWGGGPWA